MLALDLVGVIPLVGSAATTARTAIRWGAKGTVRALGRTAAGRIASKWMSRRRLAKYLNTATDKLTSKSVEEYFGKVWGDLAPEMREFLEKRFSYFVGRAGELKVMDEVREAGFTVIDDIDLRRLNLPKKNRKGGPRRRATRILDFLTKEDFKKVWGGFVMPQEGAAGLRMGAEVKVNLSEYLRHQRVADRFNKAVKKISGTEVFRLPAEVIKPEYLAEAVGEWLKQPWRAGMDFPGGVPKAEVKHLIVELQKTGDMTVGELFGLVLSYRLSREFLRNQRETRRESGGG